MNWYYSLNGQQTGPITEAQLTALVSSGVINASTLVWREGMPDWQAVSVALPAALPGMTDAPLIGGMAVPAGQKDMYVQQMREGVASSVPGMMQYGGFWIRFVARFVDGLIIQVVQAVLGFIIGLGSSSNSAQSVMTVMIVIIGFGMNLLYEMIMVGKYGATLGKMAVGLKVVRSDGSPVSMGLACGRYFATLLSSLTLLIGFIMAGFDPEKRTLHDRICETRVIKTR